MVITLSIHVITAITLSILVVDVALGADVAITIISSSI